eukprot:m.59023 g.59023  ORF g.59023 m.59023 type:complete len:82 (+) comp11742_c0_seq2:499-744(+)
MALRQSKYVARHVRSAHATGSLYPSQNHSVKKNTITVMTISTSNVMSLFNNKVQEIFVIALGQTFRRCKDQYKMGNSHNER